MKILRILLLLTGTSVIATVTGGCATKLSARPPKATYIGTETLQTFDTRLTLECVSPEAAEMRERKLKRSGMERPLYYNDKADRDNPASLDIPERFTVSLAGFEDLIAEGHQGPPRIMLQVRERRRVLRAKVYEVRTSLYNEKDVLVRKETEVEKLPRYYDFNWYPECEIEPDCRIEYTVRELQGVGGACTRGYGRMDNNGVIFFELQPYIPWGATRPEGLSFQFSCPDDSLFAEVHIPQEVFLACTAGAAP